MQNNIETALQNAKQIEVPNSTLEKVEDVLQNLKTREDTSNMKRLYIKPAVAVAAIAVMLLAFTTTALAVTGVVDFGSFFRSIFENETIAPYIITGDDIGGNANVDEPESENEIISSNYQTSDDVTVRTNTGDVDMTLLNAFIDDTRGGGLYLQFEIHDPTGTKLSDSLALILHDETGAYTNLNMSVPPDMRQWIDSIADVSPDGVQFIDERTVLADFFIPSWLLPRQNEAGDIVIQFDFIASNLQTVSVPTGFNIGEHLDMDGTIPLNGAEFIHVTGIELSGSELSIFHEDTYANPLVYGWGSGMLSLVTSSGETIGLGGQSNHCLMHYSEKVGFESFFNIGNLNPNELTLVWRGDIAEHIITGNWEFTIAGDTSMQAGVFRGYFEGHIMEVNISTTSVSVDIIDWTDWDFILELFYNEEGALALYLADGTRIVPRLGGADGGFLGYEMNFINPTDVVRVTFHGVEIGG